MRQLLCIFYSVVVLGTCTEALAATTLDVDLSKMQIGEQVTVNVFVNTKEQSINAIESSLIFPSDLLQFVASNEQESVISTWVQKATPQDQKSVSFSGIIPGGFTSAQAPIVALSFIVLTPGSGVIEISNQALYLNDGQGTEAEITDKSFILNLVTGTTSNSAAMIDNELPLSFTPEIIFDPDVFSGRATLVFLTSDTGSGISHYEVREGWLNRYLTAQSPYELRNQNLDSTVHVKAVDKMGNERVEVLYPQNWKPWYERTEIIVTILLTCLLLVVLRRFLYRRN